MDPHPLTVPNLKSKRPFAFEAQRPYLHEACFNIEKYQTGRFKQIEQSNYLDA
jgi:hypothetical protein